MTTTKDIIANAFAEQPSADKVNKAYLFGSYARGCADEKSDVDLCIEPASGFNFFTLGSLATNLEEKLGVDVDIVCGEDTFYPKARESYLKDRILIYEKR